MSNYDDYEELANSATDPDARNYWRGLASSRAFKNALNDALNDAAGRSFSCDVPSWNEVMEERSFREGGDGSGGDG